jgi:HPt (histidine-containing phosphotransfer) domain-containing protein
LRELDPAGKNQLLARVVTAFSKSLERLLPDLSQARGQQPADLDGIRRVFHTLKSSSASLGALALSRRCAELEADARDGKLAASDARLDDLLQDIEQVRVALNALV